jgi:SAM-dependent methyltransferase
MASVDDRERDAFYAELYERTTAPFITPALTEAEVDCFRRLAQPRPGAIVLDMGCGWGRHLQALRAAGLEAIGLERSETLAARASEQGPVVRGDFRALPFRDEALDSAACFYSSLFFFEEVENLEALREISRVLKAGGTFMLQSANPLHLRRLGLAADTHTLPDGGTVYERTDYDRETGRDVGFRRWTRPDGTSIEGRFSVRHYAPGELEVMGRRVGLRLERVCGDLSLSAFARHSRELIVLMRKQGAAG